MGAGHLQRRTVWAAAAAVVALAGGAGVAWRYRSLPPAPPPPPQVRLSGHVGIASAVRASLPRGAIVQVYAYAQDGPRVPLALLKRPASELPFDFTLDDSLAVNPAFRLSQAGLVVVGARIVAAADSAASPADPSAPTLAVPAGSQGVRLEIGAPPSP